MTSEKLEYDSTLGGPVVLPDYIPTYRYASEHIKEIKELVKNVKNPSNTKLIFQSLPKHMRRRAMSHHPKRLPRKYRNIHKSQMMKAGNPQITKRPSRKYRRKPSNLMKEYIRRQRKNIWLETHIWHAKRFHMINRWGYKLPYASCDKTYRACYRASATHCLLQDISYYACIEIKAKLDDIKQGFDRITSNKCGLSITAKSYVNGKREGIIDLFKIDEYPKGVLTRVNFIWKPTESILEINRKLWIFIHPSAYREVIEELIKVFQLTTSNRTTKIPAATSEMEDNDQGNEKFIIKTEAYVREPQYTNEENEIILTELKGTINRFRLTGDLSQSVLFHAFKCKPIRDDEPENWFKEFIQTGDKNDSAHKIQSEYWKKCSDFCTPSSLIPNMVLGLNIEDPRINRPSKRTKAIQNKAVTDNRIYYELPENLCNNSIWDHEIRERITKEMMSNHEYCTMRNKNALVPGERCKFENELQPIPVLLIQRPGSQNNGYKRLGYSGGWDVIIPSGYGMIVWLSLIMRGAKPGGLREITSINRESGTDQFLPDTVSAKKINYENYIELRNKYFRLPPNKRYNYNKLSICSPFRAPLQKLCDEWLPTTNIVSDESKDDKNIDDDNNKDKNQFYVLRDKQLLETLINLLKMKNLKNFPTNISDNCLIQISVKMKKRGNPGNYSIICLPKRIDLKCHYKRIQFKSNDPIYMEPPANDKNENERKKSRKQHKILLKRLRAKRVREKRKLQETSETKVKIRSANTKHLVNEQFKKMCDLWLKENPISVRNQCTREVFGYITNMAFCFTEATVTGIGYITINGLKNLIEICKNSEKFLLIRSTKSRNYRFANFKINPNP